MSAHRSRDLASKSRHRPPRALRVIGLSLVAVIGLVGLLSGGLLVVTEGIGNNVARYQDVFESVPEAERPPPSAGLTFLLVGSDSRSSDLTSDAEPSLPMFVPGEQRADVVMLARVTATGESATVISIPRDSWVRVPGRGDEKINAALSYGGAPLLIRTVEGLTGLRIDHFIVIDFAGFAEMTDAVDGIDVRVAETTSNEGIRFPAGLNHLNGREALAYVRQRNGLPRGDLDRAQRHQNVLRALLDKAASGGVVSDANRIYTLLDAVSRTVGVDDTLTNDRMRALALELVGLRPRNVSFLTAPVRGVGNEGDQSVVYLDPERSQALWRDLADGTVPDPSAYHADELMETPR